jgi:membrane associated rhomboid family serine protease
MTLPTPPIDEPPDPATHTVAALAMTARTCDAYALVLEAIGVRFAVLRAGGAYALWVDAADGARAREAIERYVSENVPKPVEPPRRLAGRGIAAAVAYVGTELLVAMAANRSLFGEAWYDVGMLDGSSLRAGDWWRPVTALTLHADLAHLASNLGFGALCLALLARVHGSGVAVLLTLAAAVAGNGVEGWFMARGHESLGASGAVFAALGLLGTVHWPTRTARGRLYLRGTTFIGALVLLALLGTGDARTDIEAHALGFAFGVMAGLPLRRALPAGRRVQLAAGLAAAATIAAAWTAAILTGV